MQKPPSSFNRIIKTPPTSAKPGGLQIGGKAALVGNGAKDTGAKKTKDEPLIVNVDVSRILVQKMLSQTSPKVDSEEEAPSGSADEKALLDLVGGNSKVGFTRDVEVHERPVEELPPEPEGPPINVEELLRPVFDELVQLGGTEEEVVHGVSSWLDDYVQQLPETEKGAVQSHLQVLFHQTQSELAKATSHEKGRIDKLYTAVKDSVEEEVVVMEKRLKGGSFKMNIHRMAAKAGEDSKAKEAAEEIAKLQEYLKQMEERLDMITRQHAIEIKRLEEKYADDFRNRGDVLAKEVERLQKEIESHKTENARMQQEHEGHMKDLCSQNEALSKIVIEMRQHAQQKRGWAPDHPPELEKPSHPSAYHGRANGRATQASKVAEKSSKESKHRSAPPSRPDSQGSEHFSPPSPLSPTRSIDAPFHHPAKHPASQTRLGHSSPTLPSLKPQVLGSGGSDSDPEILRRNGSATGMPPQTAPIRPLSPAIPGLKKPGLLHPIPAKDLTPTRRSVSPGQAMRRPS